MKFKLSLILPALLLLPTTASALKNKVYDTVISRTLFSNNIICDRLTVNDAELSGLISGPSSSIINGVALFADTTGKTLSCASLAWPTATGNPGDVLTTDGVNQLYFATPAGGGNVSVTPFFSTSNALVRVTSSTPGTSVTDSGVTLDNSNNIAGINQLTATTVNANLNGNAATATNFTGNLAGDVVGTQGATVVSLVNGQTAANVANATTLANAATNLNTSNAIVKRDNSGNFAAGTITANLTGNVTGNATTATTAVNATNATSFTGSLAGDVTGTQGATVVSLVGGQPATSVATATTTTNAATNTNTASTIVKRDGSGNFAAGNITASLTGNVTGNLTGTASNATDAVTATNFSGSLSGNVTGTQGATIVSTVGGQTAANVATATAAANAATSTNTASAIVRRDGSGNFSAGTITANLSGNATTATTATSFTGPLLGDVTGTQGGTVVSFVNGQSASNVASATANVLAATAASTPSTLVQRDSSGNAAFNQVTANLIGNATTATSFTGPLAGDVTGTQGSTVVSSVGGQSAANVASGANAANAATNANTINTIVKRDGSGNFLAGTITGNLTGNVTGNLTGTASQATNAATAVSFTGPLVGDVTGTQGGTSVSTVGGQTAASVASGSSLANAATSTNATGTIVRRDGSGNFSAGTISANLTGNVTGNVTGNLTGNASTATSATSATTATNFTGNLQGDVIGTQTATFVYSVSGTLATVINEAATTVANATPNDTPNTLVMRDAFGTFSTGMITLDNPVVNPNDAATKSYVDSVASSGLVPLTPALVVATTEITLSGLQTIDSVALSNGDRVLVIAQVTSSYVDNGVYVASSGAWSRATDFDTGNTAGQAYELITSGSFYAGSSWLCSTPTAIIGFDPIMFVQFSTPGSTNAANVGTGVGQIFRDKTGVTLNFKTLAQGSHVTLTNNTNTVAIATDATSANAANTIVARDGSGNFLFGTATGSLTGAASLNVLKAGDTMTGNLNMANQTELRLTDTTSNYAGLRAASYMPTSYTVDLPNTAPTLGQVLQASSTSALQWSTLGGTPISARTIYVAKNGSDSNDGSFASPYLTVKQAVQTANSLSSAVTPILISVGAGTYIENNSGGPITISSPGISIRGVSAIGTIIVPSTGSNDLFSITTSNIALSAFAMRGNPGGSTAAAINQATTMASKTGFDLLVITGFQTGILTSSDGSLVLIAENLLMRDNVTNFDLANVRAILHGCLVVGSSTNPLPTNTGATVSGTNSLVSILSCSFRGLDLGVEITGGAQSRLDGVIVESANNGVICSGGSQNVILSTGFILNNASTVNLLVTDANTETELIGCNFDCEDDSNTPQGTAVKVVSDGYLLMGSSIISEAVVGIQAGQAGDNSTTYVEASSTTLTGCITDIEQYENTTLAFTAGIFDSTKISINNPANVTFAGFDNNAADALTIGKTTDTAAVIYQILNGQSSLPNLTYQPDYYGYKGTVYSDTDGNLTLNGTVAASNNAAYYVITGDSTKKTAINLISDSAVIGDSDNVRGWEISKKATSADLVFAYSNSDSSGQALRGENPVMQLNGFDNLMEFPLATNTPLPTNTVAKLVWAGDTNLYRSAANTLQTDGSFITSAGSVQVVATSNNSSAQDVDFIKNRAGTAVSSGDTLGNITFQGYDGSSNVVGAKIVSNTSGTIATNRVPSDLEFYTHPDNTTAATQRMTIGTAGNVTINAPDSGVGLTVAGGGATITGTTTLSSLTGGMLQTNGSGVVSASATTANRVQIGNASGTLTSLTAGTNGQLLIGATGGAPAFNTLNSAGGTITVTGGANTLNIDTAGTVPTAFTTGSGTAIPSSGTINLPNGSNIATTGSGNTVTINLVNSPSVSGSLTAGTTITAGTGLTVTSGGAGITGTTNINTSGAATTSIGVGGTGAINIGNATGNTTISAGKLTIPAGSAATPSLQFTGSTNTGLSAATANTLSFDINGAEKMSLNATALTLPSGTNLTFSGFAGATGNLLQSTTAGTASTISFGTNGQVLIGATNGTPAFNTLTSTGNTITFTQGANTLNLDTAGSIPTTFNAGTSSATPSSRAINFPNGSNIATIGSGNTVTINLADSPSVSGSLTAGTTVTAGTGLTVTSGGAGITGATNINTTGAATTSIGVGGTGAVNIGNATGNTTISAGKFTIPAGSAATPSLQFTGSTNTGLSAATANTLSFDVSGTEMVKLDSAALTLNSGTSLTVTSGTTGVTGTTTINTSGTAGTTIGNASSTTAITGPANINTTGAATTSIGVGGTGAVNIGNATGNTTISAGKFTLPAGSAATPSLQFTGSTNTGLSAATANTLSFGVSGAEKMSLSSSALTLNSGTGLTVTSGTTSATGTTTINTSGTAGTTIGNASSTTAITGPANINTTGATTTSIGVGGTGAVNIGNSTGNTTISAGKFTIPAGSATTPSLQFTGSTNTGLSAATANTLSFDVSGAEMVKLDSSALTLNSGTDLTVTNGTTSITGITTINTGGPAGTTIGNATSTTAITGTTNINTSGTSSTTIGSAGNTTTITGTANINTSSTSGTTIGNATSTTAITGPANINTTGAATTAIGVGGTGAVNIGNTTGNTTISAGKFTIPAGSAATPSLQFAGSTNTGLSAATANTLSFDVSGAETMSLSSSALTLASGLPFIRAGIMCDQAIQVVNSSGAVTVNATTSIVVFTLATTSSVTLTLPASPTNGQLLTLAMGVTQSSGQTLTVTYAGGTVVNPISTLAGNNATGYVVTLSRAVTYMFVSSINAWIRVGIG